MGLKLCGFIILQIQRILGYGECSAAVPLLKNDSNVCGSVRYKREERGVGSSGEFNDLVQSNKKFKKFFYGNKIFKLIKKNSEFPKYIKDLSLKQI